jgi:hypothetical protein
MTALPIIGRPPAVTGIQKEQNYRDPEVVLLPTREVEKFLQTKPEHLREIVFELRNLIASAAQDAAEVVRWGGLSYFHEGRGGIVSAGICQIGIQEDHVRLEIIHGVFMDDPRHLLIGNQRYKRYVKIESFDSAPWDNLKELITSSVKFDPRSLAQ